MNNWTGDYRKFRVMIGQKLRHVSRYSPAGEYNSEDINTKWRLCRRIFKNNYLAILLYIGIFPVMVLYRSDGVEHIYKATKR